jgi:hypothetical protein
MGALKSAKLNKWIILLSPEGFLGTHNGHLQTMTPSSIDLEYLRAEYPDSIDQLG